MVDMYSSSSTKQEIEDELIIEGGLILPMGNKENKFIKG